MIYWARAKFVRFSPYKVKRVLNVIRGKNVEEAFFLLSTLKVRPAREVSKVLKSALSNSGRTSTPQTMKVSLAYAGKGPYLRRVRPRAFGRADVYTRKMAHINIGIEELK
ncbi:MAG TPA: 50S ribosomal protein L22 [bacterium]|nr:50S ribosomal protein L22 [bacterium]